MTEKNNKKNSLRMHLANTMDFSKDVILDAFVIRMTGIHDLIIENYKGILEYSSTRIRIRAKPENIKICGTDLEIKTITDDFLWIIGEFSSISFAEE